MIPKESGFEAIESICFISETSKLQQVKNERNFSINELSYKIRDKITVSIMKSFHEFELF